MAATAANPLAESEPQPRGQTLSQKAKITSKGQITIPAEVRRRMGAAAGDELIFETDTNGEIRLRKVPLNSFERFRGIGNGLPEEYQSREGSLRYLREMRGWDEIDEEISDAVKA